MTNIQNTDWFGIKEEYTMHNYRALQFYDYSISTDYNEIESYQTREEEIRVESSSDSIK